MVEWTSVQRHLGRRLLTLQENNSGDNSSDNGSSDKMEQSGANGTSPPLSRRNVAGNNVEKRPCRGGYRHVLAKAENNNDNDDDDDDGNDGVIPSSPQYCPTTWLRRFHRSDSGPPCRIRQAAATAASVSWHGGGNKVETLLLSRYGDGRGGTSGGDEYRAEDEDTK
jgi:hypothetical protein